MRNLLLIAALTGTLATAQEKNAPAGDKRDSSKPPIAFDKDPQQKRPEPTTQIITNNSNGTAARNQTGAGTVDQDVRQRVLVSLSTGSVGTQGVLASNQLTDIKVSVTNRVVTLQGEVVSDKNKEVIGKRVAGMDGVKSVNNQLTVNPNAKPSKKPGLFNPDGYAPGKAGAKERNEANPKQ
jgi:hypothetical protein